MNIFTFSIHCGYEEYYGNHFKQEHDKIGIVYRKCGHACHTFWIKYSRDKTGMEKLARKIIGKYQGGS